MKEMKDIDGAESAAQPDGVIVIASLLLAKNPSNRGRTSDLGIAQCFPLQSHALPTELSKAYYLLQKVLYNVYVFHHVVTVYSHPSPFSRAFFCASSILFAEQTMFRWLTARYGHVSWLLALSSVRHSETG
jgi:hypothetical protein